eukprot:6650332-Pyramimonas_sp.AAC.1
MGYHILQEAHLTVMSQIDPPRSSRPSLRSGTAQLPHQAAGRNAGRTGPLRRSASQTATKRPSSPS